MTELEKAALQYRHDNLAYHDSDGVDVVEVYKEVYRKAIADALLAMRQHKYVSLAMDKVAALVEK